nr:MAG TPA: hypothetical protein [Caudoviricetes sp.]
MLSRFRLVGIFCSRKSTITARQISTGFKS